MRPNFEKQFEEWLMLSEEDKKKYNPFVEYFGNMLRDMPKIPPIKLTN